MDNVELNKIRFPVIYEPECKVEFQGNEAKAGGAFLTEQGGCVYIVEKDTGLVATTWQGDVLARVELMSEWEQSSFILGSYRMRAIQFTYAGTRYHGRYNSDWSQLCKVRKLKNQGRF